MRKRISCQTPPLQVATFDVAVVTMPNSNLSGSAAPYTCWVVCKFHCSVISLLSRLSVHCRVLTTLGKLGGTRRLGRAEHKKSGGESFRNLAKSMQHIISVGAQVHWAVWVATPALAAE